MPKMPLWMLPVSMVLLNVFVFVTTLMFEGRVKANCVRFFFLYLGTIPSARDGDLQPFFTVFASPA